MGPSRSRRGPLLGRSLAHSRDGIRPISRSLKMSSTSSGRGTFYYATIAIPRGEGALLSSLHIFPVNAPETPSTRRRIAQGQSPRRRAGGSDRRRRQARVQPESCSGRWSRGDSFKLSERNSKSKGRREPAFFFSAKDGRLRARHSRRTHRSEFSHSLSPASTSDSRLLSETHMEKRFALAFPL